MSEGAPKSRKRLWLAVAGVFVVGCILIMILASLLGSPDDSTAATATQAIAEQPVATPEDTAIPPPTAEPTQAPTEPPPPTDTPLPTNTSAPQMPRLGETLEKDGYSLLALAVEDPATPDTIFYDPEPGMKLIAVQFVVGNVSVESASVNPLNSKVVDTEGFSYEAELAALADHDQIATATIGPGEKVRGWVAYELPEGASPAYLKYEFGVFTGPTLQVGLTK